MFGRLKENDTKKRFIEAEKRLKDAIESFHEVVQSSIEQNTIRAFNDGMDNQIRNQKRTVSH